MINEMLANGLERPEFYPRMDHFKVILKRPGARKGNPGHAERGKEIVEVFLRNNGELSMREIAEKSNITITQARRRVNKLLDQGIVEATAPVQSRNRKYRIKK